MKNNVKVFFGGLILLLVFFLGACENGLIAQVESARAAAVLPVLTTDAITSIASTTATGSGNITDDGGVPVTARGLCWGTDPNPTISGYITINSGVEKGAYSDLMTGLSPGTLYYVRAYATNSETTGYGVQVSFTTLPAATASITVTPEGYSEGSGKLDVSWDPVSGTNIFYDVYYSQTATRPEAANGPTDLSVTSCVLTGLIDYQTYYVWIVAKNATGSNLLSVTRSDPVAPGIPVAGINISSRVSIDPGEHYQMVFSIIPENATNTSISWSSSRESVAIISETGLWTGVSAGNSTITATAEDLDTVKEYYTVGVTGIITIAGTGTAGSGTAGGTATDIAIGRPQGITVDSDGNVYFSDPDNYCVRKVSSAGFMTTIAGTGVQGTPIAGASADTSSFFGPYGLMADSANNIYISDSDQHIWKMKAAEGTLVHIAGNGILYDPLPAVFVDGGIATDMPIGGPSRTVLDAYGNLYFVDSIRYRVRRVDHITRILSTICGDGNSEFSGDGGPAIDARIESADIAIDSSGNFYLSTSNRIRKISTSGVITTIAGDGSTDYSIDDEGAAATSAGLWNPQSVVFDSSGNIYFETVCIAELEKSIQTEILPLLQATAPKVPVVTAAPQSLHSSRFLPELLLMHWAIFIFRIRTTIVYVRLFDRFIVVSSSSTRRRSAEGCESHESLITIKHNCVLIDLMINTLFLSLEFAASIFAGEHFAIF